jgi:hypothetical protein
MVQGFGSGVSVGVGSWVGRWVSVGGTVAVGMSSRMAAGRQPVMNRGMMKKMERREIGVVFMVSLSNEDGLFPCTCKVVLSPG